MSLINVDNILAGLAAFGVDSKSADEILEKSLIGDSGKALELYLTNDNVVNVKNEPSVMLEDKLRMS